MKTIFILMDTLNRRMLDLYSQNPADTAITPNIRRLAARGVVFDQHWTGSAPCMPARRDLLTGRLNFLEKPWGGMEPFDFSMPAILAQHQNVHSQMFTDHAHYVIPGGENYTKGFTAWNVYRGQEGDPVWVRPDQNGIRPERRPDWYKGTYSEAEKENRKHFKNEYDYPSVCTLYNAAQWLEENQGADNFLLWIESFDPHEPYDCPKYYLDLYEKPGDYEGYDFTHPNYGANEFSDAETEHLKRRCKATLTMADRHLGELLDVMDRYSLWEDTMVIFTTDHGYHLGEHGYMGKNYMANYNEVYHIPLIVCHPDIAPGRCGALTQNIDILPTVMEYYQIPEAVIPYPLHGRSLLPLLRKETASIHTDILYGYFGHEVALNDGVYTYIRAPKDETNRPLNVYCAVPSLLRQYLGGDDGCAVKDYDKIEMGRFLSWTRYPVYKFPADIVNLTNWTQSFENRKVYNEKNLLFNILKDYAQEHPIEDAALEETMKQKLRMALTRHDAPLEQFERLGL